MTDMIPDDGGDGVRRQGTFMIIAGWGLAILVLVMLFNHLLDRQRNPNTARLLDSQDGAVVLQANRNGMFRAEGYVNGVPVEFLLDTGATVVSVPMHVAEKTGMKLGPRTTVNTANGRTHAWLSHIDSVVLGNLAISDVDAIILDGTHEEILLGMSALRDLDFRHSGGTIELRPLK